MVSIINVYVVVESTSGPLARMDINNVITTIIPTYFSNKFIF